MPKMVGFKRRPFKKRKRESDGKKALKLVREIKRGFELKHFDSSTLATDVDFTGQIIDLNNIAQGDGDTNRDGDKAMMTSYELRGRIQNVTGETPATRVILYLDKSGNGVPLVTELLLDTGTALSVSSMYNQDFRSKFIILQDRTYTSDLYHPTIIIHWRGKLRKMVSWSGGGSTITQNKLKMCLISSASAGTGADVRFYGRVFFTDN